MTFQTGTLSTVELCQRLKTVQVVTLLDLKLNVAGSFFRFKSSPFFLVKKMTMNVEAADF
jgi:hypothetical protein